MLAAALGLILFGIISLLIDAAFIGFWFLFLGTVTIPYVIVRYRYKFPIIESDESQIRINYNAQRLKIPWSAIQDCMLKQGMPRNGYVPIFLLIRLKSGLNHQVSLPALTIEKKELVSLINLGAAVMASAAPNNMS